MLKKKRKKKNTRGRIQIKNFLCDSSKGWNYGSKRNKKKKNKKKKNKKQERVTIIIIN